MSDINVGAISEALNNKVDLPSPTIPQDAVDYVIEMQRPTADNDYIWYRKYKSGWVEQGGICPSLGYTVTFPVVMVDDNYTALGTARNTSGDYAIRIQSLTTTGMKLNSSSSNDHEIWWQVSGMAAQ